MAKLAGYSYGSSQNHYADLLDALVETVPHLVADMGSEEGNDPVDAAQLRMDLQQRDATIARLRGELELLTTRHVHLRRYALALHSRLIAVDGSQPGGQVVPIRLLDS